MPSRPRKPSDTKLKEYLRSWGTLNAVLCQLHEDSVRRMIELEKEGRDRTHILNRLHQRYNRVRRERELRELMR